MTEPTKFLDIEDGKNGYEMLHVTITQYGKEGGEMALVIQGFTKQTHVDAVLAALDKFMNKTSGVKQ